MVFEQVQFEGPVGQIISGMDYYRDYEPENPIHRFFPDAHAYLIFELKGIPQNTYAEGNLVSGTYNKYWFSGNRTRPLMFDSGKGVEMMVLTIKNAFAYPLIGKPMDGLTNSVVQAEELLGEEINDLWIEINKCLIFSDKVRLIHNYLEGKITIDDTSRYWIGILDSLEKRYSEQIRISDLAEEVGLSQKSVINRFKNLIGITPKEFIQLKRFQKFIAALNHPEANLTQLAIDCGYFDQSHCIREFRNYTGVTPSNYLSRQTGYDNYMDEEG